MRSLHACNYFRCCQIHYALQGCFRFANPRVEVKSQHACADEFLNERQHWQEYHPRGD